MSISYAGDLASAVVQQAAKPLPVVGSSNGRTENTASLNISSDNDTVSISSQSAAQAYDLGRLQYMLGQFYTDDTVAGSSRFLLANVRDAGLTGGNSELLDAATTRLWGRYMDKKIPAVEPPELKAAIADVYSTADTRTGLSKAINLALEQRGISRDSIAGIDTDYAVNAGTVRVTFTDGRSPLELDEDYVTHFAVRNIREQRGAADHQEDVGFNDTVHALLSDLGIDYDRFAGWSVKADGTFHLYTVNDQGDGFDETVLNDPDLSNMAVSYNESWNTRSRLGLADFAARIADAARDNPDYDPTTMSLSGNSVPASLAPETMPETMAIHTAVNPRAPTSAQESAASSLIDKETGGTQPEESEGADKARARRKLLLSMGFDAGNTADGLILNGPSGGEVARLTARYGDAMSARDRMLQRFSRKGELEGLTDGVMKQTPEEVDPAPDP